jgi:orotate phosphoribosyltransferase
VNADIAFDAIGGPCVGADPIIGGYLATYARPGMRGFLVRQAEKDHGKSGLIIGSVKKGDRCIVVEDVTTTGGSLLTAIDAVEAFGCSVVMAITVVDRLQGADGALFTRSIPFESLVTIKDILPDLS